MSNCICTVMNNGTHTGIVNNISLGGMHITADKSFNAEDKITISFPIPYMYLSTRVDKPSKKIVSETVYKSVVINTNVSTVRYDENGIALKFEKLSPDDFWTLQSFVHNDQALK